MFNRESDLLDRVLQRFIGPGKCTSAELRQDDPVSRDSETMVSLNPTGATKRHAKRAGYRHAYCWAVLPSHRVPRWLLPLGDRSSMIAGTQIYEPQARVSRIMKSLLLRSIRMGWMGWAGSKAWVASKEPLALELLVKELMGEPQPVFSLSVGNQVAMRKLTVQAMRPNGEILGYMKLPLTEAATERVRHEAETLERLWAFPYLRPHLPRVLYASPYNDTFVLFQTAAVGKPGPSTLTASHKDFLQKLGNVRRVQTPERMLVEAVAAQWEKSCSRAGTAWQESSQEAFRQLFRNLNSQRTITRGVMHGDFAPWNTRIHLNRLFLFDWESASWDAPLAWDRFHFEVQTACFLKNRKKKTNLFFPEYEAEERTSFLLYTLSSAAQLIAEGADPTGINYRRALVEKLLAEGATQGQRTTKKKESFDAIGVG
jgi:hypothetical protein